MMTGLPDTVLLNINHPSLQYLVTLLQYESSQALSGSVAVVNALASVLLVFLLRACLEKNEEAQLSGLLNGWQDKRLRNLLQAVVEKPEEEWNIEKMTAMANLSRAQLMRVFKQQTGTSPHAFVNSIRLQQGALLLKQTADSVFIGCAFRSVFNRKRILVRHLKSNMGYRRGNIVKMTDMMKRQYKRKKCRFTLFKQMIKGRLKV